MIAEAGLTRRHCGQRQRLGSMLSAKQGVLKNYRGANGAPVYKLELEGQLARM